MVLHALICTKKIINQPKIPFNSINLNQAIAKIFLITELILLIETILPLPLPPVLAFVATRLD